MNDFDETIIYQDRPSWLYYYWLYVAGIGFLVLAWSAGNISEGFLCLAFAAGLASVFRFRYQFTITADKILTRQGLIARNINEMKIRHIRSIHVRQSPVERLLGIGTFTAISAADGESAVVFRGISNPQTVRKYLHDL